jgi:hypothetical protein
MDGLIKLFEKFAEYYGHTTSTIIMVIIIVLYGGYVLLKNYSSLIKTFFEKKLKDEEKAHAKAVLHRKNITPKVKQILSELAESTKADRVVLLEFSNGSSNLIGLPFLYLSITSEVVKRNVIPISNQYQKINVSVIAEFLEKLESKGYFYSANAIEMAEEFPIVYSMLMLNTVKSVLFYTIVGVDENIGFILLSTSEPHSFTREEALPKAASAAQVISSYLNYDILTSEL